MTIHFTLHSIKASLFHSPTLSHHTSLHLYIHYSPIWNSFLSLSCKYIKFIFNHLTCRSPARLSHSLPFPQTVCAEIIPIFILYYDICILYLFLIIYFSPEESFWLFLGILSSLQFSHSVMSDFLQPHESQHARLPCPSPTPRVYSNSCPSSWWCHPAI